MLLILISLALTVLTWRLSPPRARARNLFALSALTFLALSATGCSQSLVNVVDEIYLVVAGILPLVTGTLAPFLSSTEATKLTGVTSVAMTDLTLFRQMVSEYHSNPSDSTLQKVTDTLGVINAHLADLESAAHVADPGSQKKLLLIVTGVQQSLAALEASMMGNHQNVVLKAQAQAQQG